MTHIGVLLWLAIGLLGPADRGPPMPQSAPAPSPTPPPATTDESRLLERARTHRDALTGSTRIEAKVDDLEVIATFFPDTRQYLLLGELIEGLEKKESENAIDDRLRQARRRWRALAGRPGFRLELLHPEEPDPSDRALPRTVHIFPGDPRKMIVSKYGKKSAEWSPVGEPRGMQRSKIRIAKHYTSKNRRQVPFIREIEPKGVRWSFESESAVIIGSLPATLSEKKGEVLRIRFPDFDRFRGPSPEPHLLDRNDPDSSLDRKLKLTIDRSWPAPWPRLPADLEQKLEGATRS